MSGAMSKLSKVWQSVRELWFVTMLLVSMVPVLHVLVTWDLDGQLTAFSYALRHYSIIVVLIELSIIWWAIRNGLLFSDALNSLNRYVIIFLSVWFAFALAGLFSATNDLLLASFTFARYVIHGLFMIALIFLIRQATDFDIQRWLAAISFGAALYVLSLVIFCILVPDTRNFDWVRRLPSATNIRQIGNNVGMLAIAPIALILTNSRPPFIKYSIIFVILMSFALWTGGRATLLGFGTGVIAASLMSRKFISMRNILVGTLSVLSGVIVSLQMPLPHPAFGIFRLVKASGEQPDPSSGRWELWGQTWQQILASPWVGHGSGRYRNEMLRFYGTEWNHPHNFPLQYVYDWGFFGGSAAMCLIALLGLKIFQNKDAEPVARFTAIAAFVAICSTALIDSPLFHPLPIMMALALIAPSFSKPNKR